MNFPPTIRSGSPRVAERKSLRTLPEPFSVMVGAESKELRSKKDVTG
jgi:hypothetical protein